MKYFLNIALLIFIGVIIFNLSIFNYEASITSETNKIFLYSGLFAVIGIIVIFLIKQLRNLSSKIN